MSALVCLCILQTSGRARVCKLLCLCIYITIFEVDIRLEVKYLGSTHVHCLISDLLIFVGFSVGTQAVLGWGLSCIQCRLTCLVPALVRVSWMSM